MMKFLILLLSFLVLAPAISAQSVRITDKKVLEIIENIELSPVELVEVKTLRKWKALELSSDMKPQMDYNVVRVKYKTVDALKTVLIDMHLVPILYDVQRTREKIKREEEVLVLSYTF